MKIKIPTNLNFSKSISGLEMANDNLYLLKNYQNAQNVDQLIKKVLQTFLKSFQMFWGCFLLPHAFYNILKNVMALFNFQ